MNNSVYEYSFQMKKAKKRKLIFISFFIIFVFILINILLKFLIQPVRQTSVSMLPDIKENSLILISPLDVNPKRGDVFLLKPKVEKKDSLLNMIVTFFTGQQISLNQDNDFPETKSHLRRVVGMPGDTIYMSDYVLYIKPKGEKHFLTEFELIDKTYNVTLYSTLSGWDDEIGVKGSFDRFELGPDEYFLLGDNRTSCLDSRLWGPVLSSELKGRALLCYFPIDGFKIY